MGFRSKRLAQKPNEDGYIRKLIDEILGPELEFIQPGLAGKEYSLDADLIQSVNKKYREDDGSLHLEAVFIDIKGKEYTKKIIIPDNWK